MTGLITQDGNYLITDPDLGAVSGKNKREAEAEVRRLKGLRGRPEGAAEIITRHQQIQGEQA